MKSIIPYSKSISFGSKIAEITSMSLEHEMVKKPGEVSGNFIISGEYKSHEVSVNREPFLHKLPFSIELTDNIDLDSLSFEITDFSYDILNDDTVEIDIEFCLEAEEVESEEVEEERSVFEAIDPIKTDDLTDFMDHDSSLDSEVTIKEEMAEKEEVEGIEEKIVSENEVREEVVLEKEEMKEDMKESEETIINQVNPMDDQYATYHIHIVKEGETIETICTMYQSNMSLLMDYNDLKEINQGDKVIIPTEDE